MRPFAAPPLVRLVLRLVVARAVGRFALFERRLAAVGRLAPFDALLAAVDRFGVLLVPLLRLALEGRAEPLGLLSAISLLLDRPSRFPLPDCGGIEAICTNLLQRVLPG